MAIDNSFKRGNIVVNESRQTIMNNQPLFSCGVSAIKGYISVKMYDQVSASLIGGSPGGSGKDLFVGETLKSGMPWVITEKVYAAGVIPTA